MSVNLVVDANILISALSPGEKYHQESLGFLKRVKDKGQLLNFFEPPEFLLELHRTFSDPENKHKRNMLLLPFSQDGGLHIKIKDITEQKVMLLIRKISAKYEKVYVKPAADLVYLLVAQETQSILVTNDKGFKKYSDLIDVKDPGEMSLILATLVK